MAGAAGCTPALKKEAQQPEEALRQVRFFSPEFRDDMDRGSLVSALKRNLEYLGRVDPDTVFHYGPHDFSCRQVRESQEAFLALVSRGLDTDQLGREIKKTFSVYRAAGRAGDKRVLFTGYYEPIYEGSLTPDETFKFPLYRAPDDLVKIDLSPFNEKYKGEGIVARIDGKKVLPYYSRVQINRDRVLAGKGLELVWLKSRLDVAFLHIQGSGRLKLPDGKDLSVNYQASNGQAYRSIGRS